MKHYTLAELKAMLTIATGQTDDLKLDNGHTRVWLSRMTVEDGESYNNKVTVETWNGHNWNTTETYEAK